MSVNTFQTRAEYQQFCADIEAVLDKYPYIVSGIDNVFVDENGDPTAGQYDDDKAYNKDDPKFVSGWVMLIGVRNMEGFETYVRAGADRQSVFVGDGLIANAAARL